MRANTIDELLSMSTSSLASQNRAVLLIFAMSILAFSVAYADSLAKLFSLWLTSDEEAGFDYGFLVLACCFYLLYRKRETLLALGPKPWPVGIVFISVLSLAWLFAGLTDIETVQLAVLPLLVLATIAAALGRAHLRLSFIPFFLILFAVPMWWPLYPVLKDGTVLATEAFLRTIGKPVFVEGYYLHLPGGSFFVDDGCAGKRFLLVTFILTFMSTELYSLSLKRAIALSAIGVALAVIANWIRVIIVVLVGDHTEMQHRLVSDHNDLGWVVYALVVLVPLMLAVRQLAVPTNETMLAADRAVPVQAGEYRQFVPWWVLAGVLLMSGPALESVVDSRMAIAQAESGYLPVPAAMDDWKVQDLSTVEQQQLWRPEYRGTTQTIRSLYSSDSNEVLLNIAHYANQLFGAELAQADNSLVDNQQWTIRAGSEQTRKLAASSDVLSRVNSVELLSSSGSRQLVWYWFTVGEFKTNSLLWSKFLQLAALAVSRSDGNLIAISTVCESDCARKVPVLESFFNSAFVVPEI